MIVWCLTPSLTVFQLYRGGQCNLSLLSWSFFFFNQCSAQYSSQAAGCLTVVETTDSGERGMNPVAMTIINPRKEYWLNRGSNQRPPVLKSAMLPTELWGSAKKVLNIVLAPIPRLIFFCICIKIPFQRARPINIVSSRLLQQGKVLMFFLYIHFSLQCVSLPLFSLVD